MEHPPPETRRQRRRRKFGEPNGKPILPPRSASVKKDSSGGPLWDPVIGMRLWTMGLFGDQSSFDFRRIIKILGRPVLEYRN
jgi:hypothetical protein